MNIYRSLSQLVGGTPLLEVSGFTRAAGANATILAMFTRTFSQAHKY